MTTTKFLTVGDVHIADKPPGARVDDYLQTVLGKLEMVRLAAEKLSTAAVLFTGDIFHLDKAVRNSHNLVRSLIDKLREFPCPCLCAPGNHDLKNDRLDSLPKQPLGVLFSSGAMRQLTPEGCWGRVYGGAQENVYWESKSLDPSGKDQVQYVVKVAATEYNENDPFPKCQAVKRDDADFLITVGHFYSSLEGGDYYGKPCISYRDMSATETDLWVMGHFHNDRGIQLVNGKYFVGLGSLTRGVLDSDSLTRNVKIGLIELQKEGDQVQPTLKAIRLPVAPPEEIFDLVRHEEIKAERKAMDSFVQDLQENFDQAQEISLDELGPMQLVEVLHLEPPVRTELERRIREAEAQ